MRLNAAVSDTFAARALGLYAPLQVYHSEMWEASQNILLMQPFSSILPLSSPRKSAEVISSSSYPRLFRSPLRRDFESASYIRKPAEHNGSKAFTSDARYLGMAQ